MDEKLFHDFSNEDFEKITNPGLKVIDGTQYTKPILKDFYHQETHELKLVHDLDDWDNDKISWFGVLELKLLHPSYIFFLRKYRMEILKDEVRKLDRKHFGVIIQIMVATME